MSEQIGRLVLLARSGAQRQHDWYFDCTENIDEIPADGHVEPFLTCLHPDCTLVRDAAAEPQTEPALITYMTTTSGPARDAAFLRTYAERVRNATAPMWEIPNTVAGTLEAIAGRLERNRQVLQQIMQVLGPEAVCECSGCAWETNEAISLLNEIGIAYQPRGEKRMQHNVEAERRGNLTDEASSE